MNDQQSSPKAILVSAASKHGATQEIAERIGQVLEASQHLVTVSPPDNIVDVTDFDVVVLGSAVYAGHWLAAAKELAQVVAQTDPPKPTWLFSSGPIGDPPKPDEDPVDVADILEATAARDHRVFSGKIDKTKLSFGEKAILMAVRGQEGDFRDWDQIETWAAQIADDLPLESHHSPDH
jgi:menaquinone-dependent protoporphyrinogen oxidase